jgi:uncharacterized protein with HEPN domain
MDEKILKSLYDIKIAIGLRNQIIHAYDSISDENIWSIVINHIPNLKQEIELNIYNFSH